MNVIVFMGKIGQLKMLSIKAWRIIWNHLYKRSPMKLFFMLEQMMY
jgi:hypothetical protein